MIIFKSKYSGGNVYFLLKVNFKLKKYAFISHLASSYQLFTNPNKFYRTTEWKDFNWKQENGGAASHASNRVTYDAQQKKGQTLGYGSKGVKSIIKIWIIVWIYIQVAATIISESRDLQIDFGGMIFTPFEP